MRSFALLAALSLVFAACGTDGTSTGNPTLDGGTVNDTGESDVGEGDDTSLRSDTETDAGPDECVDPDGDGFGPGCGPGTDCIPDDSASYPGAPEICGDALDNDCDEFIDEDCACVEGSIETCYDGPAASAGRGVCSAGFRVCSEGVFGECQGQILPATDSETLCDGRDEDCDGEIDEGLTNACGQCGPVPAEVCGDLVDNDCNGVIDDPEAGCDCDDRTNQPCYTGPPPTLGNGQCRGGVTDCVDGAWGACVGQILPETEICDGIDNDCDGLIDEELRNACGSCGEAPEEVCDGEDNDCDGQIDEGVRLACGVCPGEVGTEECGDGLDNDCDGEVDESCVCDGSETCYPGPPAAAGVGACTQGTRSCDGTGEFWGPCEGAVLPTLEVCDGIDNDCDGVVDVDASGCSVCGSEVEICDGIDNDCDGEVDEGLTRGTCGCIDDIVPEEDGGLELCNGIDDDCDGFIDEELINACGVCDDSCYVEEFTDPEDWLVGEFEGIDEESLEDGLVLGSGGATTPDLWIANSADATVTRIDTEGTPSVVDTYPVGLSPSRTAVDFDGDVYIANRAFGAQGTVTKIENEGCTGLDCIRWQVDVGGFDQLPRGLAVDAEGFAWVGTFRDGGLYRLEPSTGTVIESYDLPINIYGLAIDSEGIIWVATINQSQGIGAFDTTTRTFLGNWASAPSGRCIQPYGIAVDRDGNVWWGNWGCHGLGRLDRALFEAGTIQMDVYGGARNTRGVAVDGEGFVYVASSVDNTMQKFDPVSRSYLWTAPTCGTPIGVGISNGGDIWTNCNASDQAQRFSPDGTALGTLPVGDAPYSYSDMTGFQLRNFTAPRGTWSTVFDCGYAICDFDEIIWDAVVPPGTGVQARARTSTDGSTWGPWTAASTSSPADIRDTESGRYCQVEITLTTTENDLSPNVTNVEVYWQRP